jgi:hypothetical protein
VGADNIQGNFVSRPLTSPQLDEFLSLEVGESDFTFDELEDITIEPKASRRHLRVV